MAIINITINSYIAVPTSAEMTLSYSGAIRSQPRPGIDDKNKKGSIKTQPGNCGGDLSSRYNKKDIDIY